MADGSTIVEVLCRAKVEAGTFLDAKENRFADTFFDAKESIQRQNCEAVLDSFSWPRKGKTVGFTKAPRIARQRLR